MAFEIGSVIARFKTDLSGWKQGIDQVKRDSDTVNKKLQDVGSNLRGLGTKMTAFSTVPLVGLATGFVKLASDAEETTSKFNVVFGDLAGDMQDHVNDLAHSIGRSRTDLMGYAATIGDTLKPLGFSADATLEMSASVVDLSEDLASFNNLNTPDVVRDIQSALVGNTETLRKYGVVASQDAIIQEALNSGLIKNKNELDATTKAQAIFNILLKGTADAQGDALRTADGTANQMRALQSEFKALAEELGQIMIPIAQELIKHLRGMIDWFRGLSDEQKKAVLIVGAVVASIGPLLIILGTLASGLGVVISVGGTLIGVLGFFLNPISLLGLAIAGLYIAWKTNFLGIRDIVNNTFEWFKAQFKALPEFIKQVGQGIFIAMTDPFRRAWQDIKELANKIRDKLDFTKRQSPSVLDIVQRGVKLVNNAMDDLTITDFSPSASLNLASNPTTQPQVNSISIDLSGALIADEFTAQSIGERIGNGILGKLKKTQRY